MAAPAVIVHLPYTSDELWPQSGITDPCKRRGGGGIVISQSPVSIGMVKVYRGRRVTLDGCLVDGPVGGILAIDLLILGDVDCLAIISIERQFCIEGQPTGVTASELWVAIHALRSDVVSRQRVVAGHSTEHTTQNTVSNFDFINDNYTCRCSALHCTYQNTIRSDLLAAHGYVYLTCSKKLTEPA